MKTKNILLLSLVSLALVGCGKNSDTSVNSTKASDAPISSKTSTAPQSSEKKDSTIGKDSETSSSASTGGSSTSSSQITTSTSESASESVSTDIYSTTLWPTAVVDAMLLHLGNRIVPYVDLGISTSKLNPDWDNDTDTLTILGGLMTGGLSDTRINTAKDDYEDEGWTVTIKDNSLTAVNADGDLTVKYYTEDDLCYFTVKYAEAFDPTKASSWPTDLMNDMNTNMNNHGADIPFVYLGTVAPSGSFADGSFTIEGGAWDDQITSLAETAFTAANASITDEAYKWTITTGTNSYGTTFKASVTLADGTVLKVSIEAPYYSSYYSTKRVAKMVINYREPFVVPTSGSWPTEISDVFNTDFDGHSIPWFYTGGTNSIYTHTSGSSTATLCGQDSTWNDKILTLAQAAFEAENTSITDDANKWKLTIDTTYSYGQEYDFERTFEDNCKMRVAVRNYSSYSNKAEIRITYTPAFVVPATGDWSTEIKQVFTNFDGHSIPWFYMGGNPTLKYYYTGDTYANIDAPENTWDDQILTLAQTACENENATISDDDNKWVCTLASSKLTCTRLFEDGCTIKFTVENYSTYYNYARVNINYQAKLVIPTTGSWNTSISDVFTNKFDGHAMPWFYAGCDPTLSSSTDYTATIYGTSGTWNDQILTLAQTACENENATITNDANKWVKSTESTYYGTKLIETRTFEDGCTLKFTVENYGTSTNKAEIHVYYTPSLIYPTGDEAQWSDAVKTKLETLLGTGETIPWIYLNAAKDKVSNSYDGSSEKDFKGGAWDDKLMDYAITELTNANEGWSCFKNTYDNQMVAVRTTAAGKNIKLVLKASSNVALLEVYCK